MTALPALLLLALAALLALPRARPLSAALWALLAADGARVTLGALVLAPARLRLGEAPYEGIPRVAFHAEQALHLAWPFAALGVCGHLFTRVRAGAWLLSAITWALLLGEIAADYPELRGYRLMAAYAIVGACASILAVLIAALGPRPAGFRPAGEHLASLLLVAGCAAELAGPYLDGTGRRWWLAGSVTWPLALAGICAVLARGRPWATARA